MKLNLRFIFGALFIFIGAMIVLQNLNVFTGGTGNIVWAALFAITSVFLFSLYLQRRENWWWLVFALIALSVMASNLAALVPSLEPYSPLFALFGTGLACLIIFLADRNNWWTLIPGGILISLGTDEILHITNPEMATSGVLFIGMGIAFLLMFAVPSRDGRHNWALLPAALFLAIGTLMSFEQGNTALQVIGPALLLLAGIGVLSFSLNKR